MSNFNNHDNFLRKFTGEYLSWKKWNLKIYCLENNELKYGAGFSKENDNQYKLRFEGEYLNGKRWNGKWYDYSKNDIIYELKGRKGFAK